MAASMPDGPFGCPPEGPVEILLVEDSPDEADLMVEALQEGRLRPRVTVVEDGEQAIWYLRRHGPFAAVPRPDLILLDLHLPRKNGHEVLADIKADNTLKHIPIVVLTTSQDEQDVLKSYNLHANCYITKPVDLEQFIKVVRSIEDFWLGIVVLPLNGKV